ncbi:LruC domain-containing protein [Bacteroides sp. BFG-638]|uniref:LruC domain-containing protein n=1 Tax=Bacteroides vicugnae TaxID=3037989 RepID=A0ABU5HKJ6_9BACE|nr:MULTISPECIES: LruC domain-containing protein [unclassified Bacteroides]MCS2950640.1 LruC domain-containing protein [Bacteroides sp. BFG-638]MCS3314246.1 LruC domain-containing protein [Bacteroides sp. BFG-637]MDY7251754.1 LruC domain-containing protein [Bacteroides sp. A1-P5]MDY7256209.1 LruC domain-containing protein [Bacteroides sp. A2-P53]
MKQNIANVFTFSLLASSISFTSCVDNEKTLFDADQLRQTYEETFPVKNIDPNGDWTMSHKVTAHVSVNGDLGTDYKIQIFDADPLSSESTAKILAEGTANQSTTLNVVMDCATALNKVFVARIDNHGHYMVQPVAIENGEVTAQLGHEKDVPTRSMSRTVPKTGIPAMGAPYTADDISSKKAIATDVQAGWDLGAGSGWFEYAKLPVFKEKERWFKIQSGTFNKGFTTTGTSGGAQAVKVIVPQGSTWIIESSYQFSDITEIVVENGGKVEIAKNASLVLTNKSYLTVMPGGSIIGEGTIQITNGSSGLRNYNAGTINCSVLDFNGGVGVFYNYGLLQLERYEASTNGMELVNHGTMEAESINGNNNTNIKNGCYLKTGKFQFGTLVMGNTSEAICEELGYNGNDNDIVMEAQSMLTCTGKASLYRTVTGPTVGTALLRINEIANLSGLAQSNSKVTNNIICEITDQTYKGEAHYDWSPFAWLVNKGLQQGATYCNPGKADFILPADGECIKEGYNSDENPDDVEIRNAVYSYAFEDNYPQAGDYDFNDIVLNVNLPAAGNDVKELKYIVDLRAVGAVKQLGAGLRIREFDKSNVEEVSFGAGATQRTNSLNSGIFENASYETNGNELVIPLFGDAHYVYGYTGSQRPMLNTGNASTPLTNIYTLEVNIKLKNAISIPSVTDGLDFFIAYQGGAQKRTEIHLNQFNSPTANGQLADKEVLDVIKAVNNTWALCVPEKFAYPTETTVITDAYAKFADWAHDQAMNTDWYNTVSSNKVMKY